MSNLSETEQQGLQGLASKVKEGEVVCFVSDKSGRWAVDTVENYTEGCNKLLKEDGVSVPITEKEHEEAEREIPLRTIF